MPKRTKIPGSKNLYHIGESPSVYLIDSYPGLGEVVRSLRTDSIGDAKKRAKELERELYKLDPNYRPSWFKEIAEEYFNLKSAEWRESTMESARDIIYGRLIPEFGHLRPEDVNRRSWGGYAERFYRENPGQFLANTRKYMVCIMNYARSEGFISTAHTGDKRWGTAKPFPISDPESREGMYIPPADFEKLIAVSAPALKVFAMMGYYMGMRPGEITGLTRDRVILEKPSVVLEPDDVKTGSRTGEGREIAIAPEVLPVLTAWLALTSGEWVFPNPFNRAPVDNMRTAWHGAIAAAVLQPYTPYDLRHSFITRKVLIEGVAAGSVAAYVGNSSAVIERNYLHDKYENTRQVVEGPTAIPRAAVHQLTPRPPAPPLSLGNSVAPVPRNDAPTETSSASENGRML